jgi:heat shock transcription factor 1
LLISSNKHIFFSTLLDGFHKIASIDNGGLKFDRDEMEFSHPCFQQGHPYLLEHIKRKIANPKVADDKSGGLKVEAVNHVLNEVKTMRGRQDSLDSRFSSMKQENEALWREVAILRQKHMKQQQIVNKVNGNFISFKQV